MSRVSVTAQQQINELKATSSDLRVAQARMEHKIDAQDFKFAQFQDSLARHHEDQKRHQADQAQKLDALIERGHAADLDRQRISQKLDDARSEIKKMRPDVELVASARRGVATAKNVGKWAIYVGGAVSAFLAWWNDLPAFIKALFVR